MTLTPVGVTYAADEMWYVGAKAGWMMIDNLDIGIAGVTVDADNGINGGIVAGYQLRSGSTGSVAIEGEFTTALSVGEMTVSGPGGSVAGDWEVQTMAVYGAYRSAGDLYFKAKMGFLSEDVDITLGGASTSGSDSGVSFGIGGGWQMGTGRIELEYTTVEEDINFFSIAYLHTF